MPDTYPEISYDRDGVCSHCLAYKKTEPLGENRLLDILGSKSGPHYDCVVGISGGKDSCYVAYLAKKILGLRTLAVTYDFPFMVDLARENSRRVCESLGVELLVVKSSNNFEYDLLRNHLISLAATGTTWGQCMFCHYGIEAILYGIARSKDIPFILSGVTDSETWWNPGNRLGILTKRLRKLSLSEQVLFGFYQSRAYMGLVDQRRQFPIPGNHCLNVYHKAHTPENGLETIPIFRYIAWDQDQIEKTLQAETGWQKPARSLTWRYDCILEPLLDYTNMKEFGISSAGLYLCGLIRSGVVSREQGLALLDECEDQTRLNTSLKLVLDFLEIPVKVQNCYFSADGPDRP
jgi:hypothetical protein